jgi:hypothetical protein
MCVDAQARESRRLRDIRDRERRAIQQHTERQREAAVLEELTFQPQLNPRSRRLAAHPPASVFTRLYESRSPAAAVAASRSPRAVRRMYEEEDEVVEPLQLPPTAAAAPAVVSLAAVAKKASVASVDSVASVGSAPRSQPVTPVAQPRSLSAVPVQAAAAAAAARLPAYTAPLGDRKFSQPVIPERRTVQSTVPDRKHSMPALGPRPPALGDAASSAPRNPSPPPSAPSPPPPPPPPPPPGPAVRELSIVGSAVEGSELLARAVLEHADAALSVVRWLRVSSRPGEPGTVVAAGPRYVATKADIGAMLRAEAMPRRADAEGSAAYADTAPVAAGAPRLARLELQGGPTHDSTLRIQAEYFGGDAGTPVVAWQRTPPGSSSFVPVTGAASLALPLSADDIDCMFRAVYIPVRADGVRGAPATAASARIVAAPAVAEQLSAVYAAGGGTFSCTQGGEPRGLELGIFKIKLKKGKRTVAKGLYTDVVSPTQSRDVALDGAVGFVFSLGGVQQRLSASSPGQRDVIVLAIRQIARLKRVRPPLAPLFEQRSHSRGLVQESSVKR